MQMILITLAVALAAGKFAAVLCERAKLPPVVGEILAGFVLANLFVVWPAFTLGNELSHSRFLHEFAELGIILMLFEVGLESTLAQVARVGARATLVAVVGVVSPLLLTLGLWKLGIVSDHLPSGASSFIVPLFVGATMTATSVGITARILTEAGIVRSRTGQIILNAAVIDDVLGLLVLAFVMSLAGGAALSLGEASGILGKVLVFFGISIPLGWYAFPRLLKWARGSWTMALGLVSCFLYAWGGMKFGLAPIVGAFFAGLLIDDAKDEMKLTIEPIVKFLSPLFFVLVGAQVSIAALAAAGSNGMWRMIGELVLFVVVAIAGKLVCAFVAGKGVDRVAVGLGMAPRGEVGLIFAMTGKQAGVLSDELFGVLVFVVLLSTLIPGIALGSWLRRR